MPTKPLLGRVGNNYTETCKYQIKKSNSIIKNIISIMV